jgi:Ala-tRNA(Pro) deacylase
MPLTPQELLAMLGRLGIKTSTHEHEAVFTVEQSRHVHEMVPGAHTKNLFVKDKKDNYFLIIAESSARIPMNQVHGLIGAKSRLSFANADRLMELLGVLPGSVTAFAPVNDTEKRVTVIIDEPLLDNEQINCHPLTNTMTTTISKLDLMRFLGHVEHAPMVVRLSGGSPEDGDAAQSTE